jgi:hypothetical protein
MAFKKSPKPGRRRCPECQTGMIVVAGFGLDPEHKTFECLQCGQIVTPLKPTKRLPAAAQGRQTQGCIMPQIQPYPPVCPRCKKIMKLMLEKGSGSNRKFQCADCGETDPMQDLKTKRWLNGELRERK